RAQGSQGPGRGGRHGRREPRQGRACRRQGQARSRGRHRRGQVTTARNSSAARVSFVPAAQWTSVQQHRRNLERRRPLLAPVPSYSAPRGAARGRGRGRLVAAVTAAIPWGRQPLASVGSAILTQEKLFFNIRITPAKQQRYPARDTGAPAHGDR